MESLPVSSKIEHLGCLIRPTVNNIQRSSTGGKHFSKTIGLSGGATLYTYGNSKRWARVDCWPMGITAFQFIPGVNQFKGWFDEIFCDQPLGDQVHNRKEEERIVGAR